MLLPESATAIQPRIGESTTKAVPTLEKPLAIEFAMPEKSCADPPRPALPAGAPGTVIHR